MDKACIEEMQAFLPAVTAGPGYRPYDYIFSQSAVDTEDNSVDRQPFG